MPHPRYRSYVAPFGVEVSIDHSATCFCTTCSQLTHTEMIALQNRYRGTFHTLPSVFAVLARS
jgi:hypothetical protein